MKKTLLVLKHEITTILTSKSFWFGAVGIPLIGILIFLVAGQIGANADTSQLLEQFITSSQSTLGQGYVDHSGLIQKLPKSAEGKLFAYDDEDSAYQSLADGEIDSFFIISADYLQSGGIILVKQEFSLLSVDSSSTLIERVLKVNLLGGDIAFADRISQPMVLNVRSQATAPERDQENAMTFFLPYLVTIIYYILILGSASLLLNSVAKEKENKVIEVLMMSVTPRQLLNGKILGLGLISLFQAVFWVGTSFLLLRASGQAFDLPDAFQLPLSFLVWALVYFLFGYAIYASLMAGLGALVPNLREASQATIVVMAPLIVPMFMISILIEDPNGIVATVLSIFPLTAPVTMMTRLSAGAVPAWQLILSLVLLALTVILILRVVANMFHAQTLLSGQNFKVQRFLLALIGKA